jgi:hypothetical protein
VAYAAEWDLDDRVLDREEVEAVVAHVAATAHVAAEVTLGRRGLLCTFRFPVASAAEIVSALDPGGDLLGDEWYRDLDPPVDNEDGYTVRVELAGPVDGGFVDDDDPEQPLYHDEERREPRDDDDEAAPACVARLRVESFDNREAWPVAFALAAAIVERLGGDLREELDEDLYLQQLHLPRVIVRGEGASVGAQAGVSAQTPAPRRRIQIEIAEPDDEDEDADDRDDELLN